MKRVLVLGAGLVVKPLLDDLLALPGVELHLATLNIDRARELLRGQPRAVALEINADDHTRVAAEVAAAQVVVSLLPADQHVKVAQACLAHRVPLVTTSYVSDGMRALDGEARARGVLLLNECGFDPGFDHMTAVQTIRRLHGEGATVLSFASYGGAIPAPEANTNPWGYKFTWSPRGVVMAARNPVRYLKGGRVVERTFPDLFRHPREIDVAGVGRLEAYPNRDCLRYLEAYSSAACETSSAARCATTAGATRGAPCSTWACSILTPRHWCGLTYVQFLERHLGEPAEGALVERLAQRIGCGVDDELVARLEWLGLLSDRTLASDCASSLDVLTARLERMLRYRPGERDMAVMEHHLTVARADGRLRNVVSRMLLFGRAGDDSALARTVSFPAAMACRQILDGAVTLTGVQIPVDPQLTLPILLGLHRRGLHVHEYEEDVDLPGQYGLGVRNGHGMTTEIATDGLRERPGALGPPPLGRSSGEAAHAWIVRHGWFCWRRPWRAARRARSSRRPPRRRCPACRRSSGRRSSTGPAPIRLRTPRWWCATAGLRPSAPRRASRFPPAPSASTSPDGRSCRGS